MRYLSHTRTWFQALTKDRLSLCENSVLRTEGCNIHDSPFAFYPWTSDDGFSVVDYRKVDERNGTWDDISRMSEEFELMFDLVLNHCSSKSPWFKECVSGIEPGTNYIMEGDEDADLSAVGPSTFKSLTDSLCRRGQGNVRCGRPSAPIRLTSIGLVRICFSNFWTSFSFTFPTGAEF